MWALQELCGGSKEQSGMLCYKVLVIQRKCMMMCRSKGWVGEDAGCKRTGCCHEVLPEGSMAVGWPAGLHTQTRPCSTIHVEFPAIEMFCAAVPQQLRQSARLCRA